MYYHSTTPKYGIDARRDAANLGIPQLVIDNTQENNDVSAALFAQGVYSIANAGSSVWLGLTDSSTLYNFRVISTGAAASFFNWVAGEPNNLSPACKVGNSCAFCFGADAYWCQWGEDCVVMRASGQWLDNTCEGSGVTRIVVLELNTCPVLIKPRDSAICAGNTVNLSTGVVSGGTSPYTYTWNPGGLTGQNVSVSPTGNTTYTVEVSDHYLCKTDSTFTVSVSTPTPPAINASQATVCKGVNDNISLSTVSGTATYSWSFGAGASTVSGSGGGPYSINWSSAGVKTISVTVTDNGCSSTASRTVNVDSANAAFTASPSSTCIGQNVTTVATVPSGTATYNWNFGGGTVTSGSGAGPYSVNWGAQGTQTISLTVTDNGCQANASSTVNISDSLHPLFSLNPSGLACQGQAISVTLTGTPSGTATYNWNFNGGTILSGSGPGPYSISWGSNGNKTVTLTVTDGGCTGSTFQSIDILNAATANAGPDIQICPGIIGNLGTAPTGGYTYSWTPAWGLSSSTIANPTITIPGNATGANIDTFYILTTTSGICTARDTVNVRVYPDVSSGFTISPTSTCQGSNVTVTYTGTVSGTSNYNWNFNGATVVSGSAAGPYTINWPAAGNQTVDLTVTDNGCTSNSSDPITISSSLSPAFTLSSNTACAGQSVSVTLTGAPSGTATYTWNFSGGTILSGSGPGPYTVSWISNGAKVIDLTVTDGGCSGQASQTATIGGSATVNAGPDQTICSGGTVQLGTAAISGVTYQWTPATNLSSASVANPTFSEVNAGATPDVTSYMLVADSSGCRDTAYVTVTADPPSSFPIAVSGATSFCQGDSMTLADTLSAQINYLWSTAETTSSITVKSSGTFSVTSHDANGCIYVSNPSMTVTVYPKPLLSLAPNGETDESCPGANDGSLTVQTTGGTPAYSYGWYTTPQQTGATASGLAPGSYGVMVMDNNGCMDSNRYTVNPAPYLGVNIDSFRNISCYQKTDGTIYTSAVGGNVPVQYLWSTGAVTSSIKGLSADTFSVTVTDAKGCHADTAIVMAQPAPITVTTISTLHIDYGGSQQIEITVAPSSNYIYTWSPGASLSCTNCPEPVASPLVTTAYTLTITDATGGCSAMDTLIMVVDPSKSFYFPNAFTPNNDGINDTYLVFAKGPVKYFQIEIFDRWGEKVYDSNDIGKGWDGTYHGVYVSDGNYVYQSTITFLDGQTQTCKGSITVLK